MWYGEGWMLGVRQAFWRRVVYVMSTKIVVISKT